MRQPVSEGLGWQDQLRSMGAGNPYGLGMAVMALLIVAVSSGCQAGSESEGAAGPGSQSEEAAGPVEVLLVTKGHGFDRASFFGMFDALSEDGSINWTHVEQPAAQVFWDPARAEDYDVFVYFDAFGRGNQYTEMEDGSRVWPVPSPEAQADFAELLRQGQGMVFFHHANSAWVQSWPEYAEVVGGACDWSQPVTVRGETYPFSGFRPGIEQRISIQDPTHPVVAGLEDGFEIQDETYLCPFFEDSVHPLLRTDFEPIAQNFPIQLERDPSWDPPPGSNLTAWVKTAENSPIAYIQHGHDATAWENESFRTLMANAIRWAASEEARVWAAENPQQIF